MSQVPRKPVDEGFPTSPTRVSVHDPERRLSERNSSPNLGITSSATLVRTRRPASPLRHVSQTSTSSLPPTTPSSVTSSPSYRPLDYPPPGGYAFAASMPSSSVPSTPTSTRSRSPSISSLETIPDSPDAEEAALEAERIAQLKAAAILQWPLIDIRHLEVKVSDPSAGSALRHGRHGRRWRFENPSSQ